MGRLIVASNRVPAARERNQLAGGLAIGLKEALADQDAMWFGWSGSTAHSGDSPERPVKQDTVGAVTFATVDLSAGEHRGFYQGYANGILWPLLHYRAGLMEYNRSELDAYLAVNDLFATNLAPLLRADDIVWVHDYHLIPLGRALRARGVRNRVGFFLHIPFPPPALYAALPGGADLLQALASYDVIGVQTAEDRDHLNAALSGAGLDARAEAFPIGIDPDEFAREASRAINRREGRRMRESLGERALLIGVDRLDYSKGIPQRLRGFNKLLERFPEHRNRVTFLQVAPVSRGDVAEYRALRRTLDELAGHINGDHAEFDWVPIRYMTRSVARPSLAGFHRMARVGLVTPLRDGMNLVAKEYVAAQDPDDPGVLVLSRFAGCAANMPGAILVNPHDPDEIAEAIDQALRLGVDERRARQADMRTVVWSETASAWGKRFLRALRQQDGPAAAAPAEAARATGRKAART